MKNEILIGDRVKIKQKTIFGKEKFGVVISDLYRNNNLCFVVRMDDLTDLVFDKKDLEKL